MKLFERCWWKRLWHHWLLGNFLTPLWKWTQLELKMQHFLWKDFNRFYRMACRGVRIHVHLSLDTRYSSLPLHLPSYWPIAKFQSKQLNLHLWRVFWWQRSWDCLRIGIPWCWEHAHETLFPCRKHCCWFWCCGHYQCQGRMICSHGRNSSQWGFACLPPHSTSELLSFLYRIVLLPWTTLLIKSNDLSWSYHHLHIRSQGVDSPIHCLDQLWS